MTTIPIARVLVVDDDPTQLSLMERILTLEGYEVDAVRSASEARAHCERERHDVVLTDVWMPGEDGVTLLREVAERCPEVPVVLMTARTSLATIDEAFELGAFHFLRKPIVRRELARTVRRAVAHRRERREAALAVHELRERNTSEIHLRGVFESAMRGLWMAYQPIVDASGGLFGHETLVRTHEASVPHPGVLLDVARAVDGLATLGREIRRIAPAPLADGSGGHLFLNLLPEDLEDDCLYDPTTPLGRIADRVVLELTERAPLKPGPELEERLSALRRIGYRFAIDDLGAGYAGLSSLALVEPELVKLDRSLVDRVDESLTKQRLVRAITALCEQRTVVLAEGVERAEERDCLASLGCTLFQGYYFARPGPAFPSVCGT